MKIRYQLNAFLIAIVYSLVADISQGQSFQSNASQNMSDFKWPNGKKMALSLTFDDARLSQADKGIPLLDKYRIKGTFYLSPDRMAQRLEAWRAAVKNGHDIGNHSILHPCTGNFDWSKQSALENYTLSSMYNELDSANKILEKELGVQPHSFAFPCGQTFVGKGSNARSYVPVIAALFESGRGWLDEGPTDPVFCDMSQLTGMELDGKSFEEIKKLIDSAKRTGKWLILAGHEMDKSGPQTSLLSTIEAICKYALDPANGIWIDNVHNIASYVNSKRDGAPFSKSPDYKNPLLSVEQRVNDLISRMTLKEKIGQLNIPCAYYTQLGWGFDSTPNLEGKEYRQKQLEGAKKWAEGTHNNIIGPGGGFFTLSNQLVHEGSRKQAEVMNELQKIAVEKTRLGIPLFMIEEGTHGLMATGATIFPEGLNLGASWNKYLVYNVYRAAAQEGSAIGMHGLCTLVIEPNRDPRMGRNEEGFSEDPYMCSRVAESIVQALQGNDISGSGHLVAFLCHYPGQSQPVAGLERGAMEISVCKFRDVFLPPWIAGIKKNGALGVMATYPTIDGVSVHSSKRILTDILRKELGFEGIVLCEGGGMETNMTERHAANQKEAGILSIKAGVDVGISVEDAYLGSLIESVNEGRVPMELIDRSVARVLRLKFRKGLFENPYVDPDRAERIVKSKEHRELALESARQGIVLLKNEKNVLPLKKDIKSIAVIGPLADTPVDQLGDYYASNPSNLVSVLQV
jgi:beta-glucosidase-like glycosyl hydrolase/peptidoglycan/xylan/chitin deacetylase (PgdA/CDA1 family)